MAWDIHGNHLRAGYCEVHPDVPESYPCGYCRDEMDRAEMDRDQQQAEQQAYDQYQAEQATATDLPPF
jgi:hypothetical protein